MAIYRVGRASMDAQGYVTGTGGTKWREQLTMIRSGATIVFLTSPSSFATISEVIADDRMRVVSSAGKVIPESDYVILLHDSLTVDGLAQDVAETLRYYQGKETQLEAFIEFLKGFDFAKLEQLTTETRANAAAAADSQKKAQQNETNTAQYKDQALAAAQGAEQNKTLAGQYKDRAVQAETAANQAKDAAAASQAAAKAEADRAAQITGIDTVYDAIGNAAIPFPDVWIPFNDSLQMISGYGEEVKVGGVTVAKIVSFSRGTTATYIDKSGILKTAQINEPRFEKDGLLKEWQSTNLVNKSEDIDFSAHTPGGATVKTERSLSPRGITEDIKSIEATIKLSNVSLIGAVASIPSGSKCFSFFFKIIRTQGGFSIYTNPQTSNKIIIKSDGSVGPDTASVFKADVIKLQNGWFRLTGLFETGSTRLSVTLPVIGDEVAFFGIQIEPSDKPTSYIPTAGTQSTRSDDVVKLKKENNNCSMWFNGSDRIEINDVGEYLILTPRNTANHLRNVKGFYPELTPIQIGALK